MKTHWWSISRAWLPLKFRSFVLFLFGICALTLFNNVPRFKNISYLVPTLFHTEKNNFLALKCYFQKPLSQWVRRTHPTLDGYLQGATPLGWRVPAGRFGMGRPAPLSAEEQRQQQQPPRLHVGKPNCPHSLMQVRSSPEPPVIIIFIIINIAVITSAPFADHRKFVNIFSI